MTDKRLVQLAREQLWIAEVGFGTDGSVTFNAEGLGAALDASRRLLAHGRPPGWVSFALCDSLEMAQAACDSMEERLCQYAVTHGQAKPITLRDRMAELIREWQERESEQGTQDETEDEESTAPAEVAGRWEH